MSVNMGGGDLVEVKGEGGGDDDCELSSVILNVVAVVPIGILVL